jgi:hypothetical protein
LRQVDFLFDGNQIRGLEQNPETKSQWAQMARSGSKVMQFLGEGRYMANVVDGKPPKLPIERYEHSNIVTPETDPVAPTHKNYDYIRPVPSVKPHDELDYDPHLDPQLVWAGKKEHSAFEVPTVSLHVYERIDSHTIIEAPLITKHNFRVNPSNSFWRRS